MAESASSVGGSVSSEISDLRRRILALEVGQSAQWKTPPPSIGSGSIAGSSHGGPKKKLLVRIGTVTTPSKFWVCAINPPGKIEPDSSLGQVLNLEAEMDEVYGGEKKTGFMKAESVKPGVLIAVRPSCEGHWHRGEVLSSEYFGKRMFLRVFLVDYGDILNGVPFPSRVRKLPKNFKQFPKPRAFQVSLRGLRPVTWRVNFEGRKMGEVAAERDSEWPQAAKEIVLGLYESSPNKLAYLSTWKTDSLERCHGSLELIGFHQKVVVDQVLIKSGHARFFEQALIEDFGPSPDIVKGPKFISVCTRGPEKGTISIHESLDFASSGFQIAECGEDSSSNASYISDDCASSQTSGDKEKAQASPPLELLDPETGTVPSTYCRMNKDIFQLSETLPEGGGLDSSFLIGGGREQRDSSRSSGKMLGKRLLEVIERRENLKSSQTSLWTSFHEVSGEEDGELDGQRGVQNKMRIDEMKVMRIPAGVDTGRFLEEQLKRIPDGAGIGPKRLAEILP